MNRPFEYKDKEKGMRRQSLQPPSLLHQFVSCRFYYYYYCQVAIRRSNLHSISWVYNVPKDKRFMDWAVFMTYADWQEIAAESKIPWKADSQGWQSRWHKEKLSYWGWLRISWPPAFILHRSGGWEYMVDFRESQEEAPGDKWPSKEKPTASSRSLYKLPPSPPLSPVYTPMKANLSSHCTNGLPFCEFFLECAPLHYFTHWLLKCRSAVSSSVNQG